MTTIKAKGSTEFGDQSVTITGGKYVSSIESKEEWFADFMTDCIHSADGRIANNYHPADDTMLQAYAACRLFFREDDIEVDGDLGEIECEEGVIY